MYTKLFMRCFNSVSPYYKIDVAFLEDSSTVWIIACLKSVNTQLDYKWYSLRSGSLFKVLKCLLYTSKNFPGRRQWIIGK